MRLFRNYLPVVFSLILTAFFSPALILRWSDTYEVDLPYSHTGQPGYALNAGTDEL